MRTIRWGIIGVGDVTEVKSGPGFQKASNSSLVAVMRRNGALAKDYAERHNVPRWYDDAAALINDREVEAVYIATPPNAHKQYTLLSTAAGKPVYVEKPMALTGADCQEMISACQAAQVPLWVGYYRRALPRFTKIKELITAGAIGESRSVTITLHRRAAPELFDPHNLPWRVVPELSGGGIFVDMGSHTLDFLDYLFGPIRTVRGVAVNQGGYYPAEDHVAGTFVFDSGVVSVGTWCFTTFQEVDQTEIVGTLGKISFASFKADPIKLTTAAGLQELAIGDPPHVHQPLIQTIVDELNGAGLCPSTGQSGARTSWVVDQLLAEYREQMKVSARKRQDDQAV
jgi:predicted dehydrogenase